MHKNTSSYRTALVGTPLKAQWEFLAQFYIRLAERPNQIDDEEIFGDPIPWDRERR
jgi:hypothetical protein